MIETSTTDGIPGEYRPIVESVMEWSTGDTIDDAYNGLCKRAESQWDAIIGVRFVAAPYVFKDPMDNIDTIMKYTAYGTCIAYENDEAYREDAIASESKQDDQSPSQERPAGPLASDEALAYLRNRLSDS